MALILYCQVFAILFFCFRYRQLLFFGGYPLVYGNWLGGQGLFTRAVVVLVEFAYINFVAGVVPLNGNMGHFVLPCL